MMCTVHNGVRLADFCALCEVDRLRADLANERDQSRDLITEMQGENDRLRADLADTRRRSTAVRKLHRAVAGGQGTRAVCAHSLTDYPCATIAALSAGGGGPTERDSDAGM